MRKLYEINEDLQNALDQARIEAEENDGVVSEDIGDIIENLEIERKDKIEGVALYLKEISAFVNAIKNEEDRLKQIKLSASKEIDGLKKYLSNALLGEKFKTEKCNVSFRKSVATIIEDEEKIPVEYIKEKITRSPDKTAIKNAINSGNEVPGAYLQENKNITVK